MNQPVTRKSFPRIALIIVGALIVICLLCSIITALFPSTPQTELTSIPATQTTSSQPTVSLTLNPNLNGTLLQIQGNTDLPNGTYLSYDISHEQLLTNTTAPLEQLHTEGLIQVSNGAYKTEIDLTDWLAGQIEVWVAFQTIIPNAQQPQEIIQRFGQLGELLQGENVTKSGELKRVELTQTLTIP